MDIIVQLSLFLQVVEQAPKTEQSKASETPIEKLEFEDVNRSVFTLEDFVSTFQVNTNA